MVTVFTPPISKKVINLQYIFDHRWVEITTKEIDNFPWKKRRKRMAAFSGTSSSKEMERFSRFLAVGSVGTLLDFSLLTLLKLAGLDVWPKPRIVK